jgi:glyoxylase-like metal-dependent hydrolase (beta-lactamase superfamily II)
MRLVNNLYYYIWEGRGNNCNTYLFANVLRGDRPHVLIDPGHVVNELSERCLERLLQEMSKDGFQPEDVGLIINTHSHIDHCEANLAVVDRSRAKPSRSKAQQALIALHKEEDEYRKTSGRLLTRMLGKEVEFEPSFYLQEGELNLGKEESKLVLQVFHTPGHSPGSICLYWKEAKVLITGDLIFFGGVGRIDLPGGDGRLLKQSIERMSQLEVEYLLPGHSTELGSILRGKDKVARNFALIRMNYLPLL